MTTLRTGSEPQHVAGMVRLGVRPPLITYCRQLWRRRDFVMAMPVGQLQSRNANTALGSLWHLLNPLILAAVYFLVFGVIFDARDDVDNFAGFLVTGMFVFYYTQKCLTRGATAIVSNQGIIRNVNLPRAVFPLGSVIAETLTHLPAVGLLLGLLLATGESVQLTWLLLVPLILLQAVFNLGLTLLFGRLTFHVRDTQQLLPFATRLWLYTSGVFFTASRVPEGAARAAFEANPLQLLIRMHREALMDGTTAGADWLQLVGWATGALLIGFVYFWAGESSYGRD